jgi:hypothetical protein
MFQVVVRSANQVYYELPEAVLTKKYSVTKRTFHSLSHWLHLTLIAWIASELLKLAPNGGLGDYSLTQPATPPCVRVRTRRFESVTLTVLEQGRKSERSEVRIRERHRQGLGLCEVPRAATAAGGITRQRLPHPQFQ